MQRYSSTDPYNQPIYYNGGYQNNNNNQYPVQVNPQMGILFNNTVLQPQNLNYHSLLTQPQPQLTPQVLPSENYVYYVLKEPQNYNVYPLPALKEAPIIYTEYLKTLYSMPSKGNKEELIHQAWKLRSQLIILFYQALSLKQKGPTPFDEIIKPYLTSNSTFSSAEKFYWNFVEEYNHKPSHSLGEQCLGFRRALIELFDKIALKPGMETALKQLELFKTQQAADEVAEEGWLALIAKKQAGAPVENDSMKLTKKIALLKCPSTNQRSIFWKKAFETEPVIVDFTPYNNDYSYYNMQDSEVDLKNGFIIKKVFQDEIHENYSVRNGNQRKLITRIRTNGNNSDLKKMEELIALYLRASETSIWIIGEMSHKTFIWAAEALNKKMKMGMVNPANLVESLNNIILTLGNELTLDLYKVLIRHGIKFLESRR